LHLLFCASSPNRHSVLTRLAILFAAILFAVAVAPQPARAQSAQLTAGSAPARTIAHAIKPSALAVDSQSRVYFSSANRVYRVSPHGDLELVAGNGQRGSLGDGGAATAAQLNLLAHPAALALDHDDNLYILDAGNETIRRVDAATGLISSVSGRWAHSSAASTYPAIGALTIAPAADSPASSRLFFEAPSGLITADLSADSFSPVVGPLAAILSQRSSSTTPPAETSTNSQSIALAISPDSREMYIASPAGLFRASLAASADSPATPTLIHPPLSTAASTYSLAVSPSGQLYVSIASENRILRFDSQTHILTAIETTTPLNQPSAIAFDLAGNLYVADTNDDAVREIPFAASGSVTLFPTRYPFATQLEGGQTPPHTFVLTNGTSGTVSGITISFVGGATPADFIETNTCSSQLEPGASCNINVSFAPQATGARTAILSVTDSDPSSPQTAELTGVGDDFEIQLQNGAPSTLTVVAGGKAIFDLEAVSNSFSGKVTFACPTNLPLYVTCAVDPTSVTVSPNSPQKFTASFQTTTRIVSDFAPPALFNFPSAPASQFAPVLALIAFSAFAWLFFAIASAWGRSSHHAAPRSRPQFVPPLLAAASVLALFLIAGCKHNTATSPVGTAAGTYNFTVTASAQNATRAVSLTLTVQ
jgi:sugar lactone lactonase YvrE